jgi:O6-methylguanine-DNA--protein-cysteine methyltransferase
MYEVGKYYLCDEHKDLKQYQSKKVKKPRRIKKVSDKRKVENEVYTEVRKEYLSKNPMCECCQGLATEIHHKAGRVGTFLTDSFTFMAICAPCHRLLHDDHSYALETGYIWSIETKEKYLKLKK